MSKVGYNISAARVANDYVKKKMTIGASNKLRWDFPRAWACSGSLINTGYMRKHVDREVKKAFETETYTTELDGWIKAQKIYLEKSAQAAEIYGCGNCGEQSAIAFVYLRGTRTFPLDWMEVNDFSHAFVIIGRARASDTRDFTTWGEEAVICDPWRDVVSTVKSETAYFMRHKPNWLYSEIE